MALNGATVLVPPSRCCRAPPGQGAGGAAPGPGDHLRPARPPCTSRRCTSPGAGSAGRGGDRPARRGSAAVHARGGPGQVREGLRHHGVRGLRLSETSPVVLQPARQRAQAGFIGSEARGAAAGGGWPRTTRSPPARLAEPAVAGQYVMKGYRHKPEATEEAMRGGWFQHGDMARQDEDGMFFIVDRKKDMTARRLQRVPWREVEEVSSTSSRAWSRPPWWGSRTRSTARRSAPWCVRVRCSSPRATKR
ncbi:AMP-binding protein [Kocuria rhizophila]|nr:AMP-binding protein [Kocuria rhizophila]